MDLSLVPTPEGGSGFWGIQREAHSVGVPGPVGDVLQI